MSLNKQTIKLKCKKCGYEWEMFLSTPYKLLKTYWGNIECKENICFGYCSQCIYKINFLKGRDFTRERARQRDDYTCQICGSKWIPGNRRFDVHHKDAIKDKTRQYDQWEKEKDNLITLCHKCHLNLPVHKLQMTLSMRNKPLVDKSHF